jgi:1,4-dihydroxy-2-naphthoate polyprenyltransferase
MIKNILIHLRIPFSILLLPVFLLALSQTEGFNTQNCWIIFILLHFIVYPSSNGFNSLMDRDKGSIGLIENPQEVPSQMRIVTLILDFIALSISFFTFKIEVFILLLSYILASRAYSFRGIRLKKYAFIGFFMAIIFQGPVVYLLTKYAITDKFVFDTGDWILSLVSLLLIGAGYPISQIYQHEQDKADDVETISMVLGINGTFIFSLAMFMILNALLTFYFLFIKLDIYSLVLFLVLTSPVSVFFFYWMRKTKNNPLNANYKNTMKLNLLGAICNNLFFMALIIKQLYF